MNAVEGKDGKVERGRLLRRVWPIILVVACFAQIADYFGSERGRRLQQIENAERAAEREVQRKERAARAVVEAERIRLQGLPHKKFVDYKSVEPVHEYVLLGEPSVWQTTGWIHYDGVTNFDDRLACRQLLEGGKLGAERLLPSYTDAINRGPRVLSAIEPAVLPDGYTWSSGEWEFPGPGPRRESDCHILSDTHVIPMARVRKGGPIRSQNAVKYRKELPDAEE